MLKFMFATMCMWKEGFVMTEIVTYSTVVPDIGVQTQEK